MELEEFLDRVVPDGNYLALVYKFQGRGMVPRFFSRANIQSAAGFARWASSKGADVWHALASFKDAELRRHDNGSEYYTGARTQANAEKLRCFWFDADIKREGDGKETGRVFADTGEVVTWVGEFHKATSIPIPNLWVRSGYGIHLYWVLEDALMTPDWVPYAEAMKAALAAHGAKGDLAVVADAARILRPIDTFNYKVPASPAPCYLINDPPLPDYPNATFLAALQKFIPTVGNNLGTPPRRGPTPVADAAKMKAAARPRDFGLIASQCAQVHTSLDEGGAKDGRPMWHNLVMLAWFCEQGRDWAHLVSNKHPKYTKTSTDAEFDRNTQEHARKPYGPPLCKTLDEARRGVCAQCPHRSHVKSPWQLGLNVNPNELPDGFQREDGWIWHLAANKKGELEWRRLIEGDFVDPRLEPVDDHYRLCLTYVGAGEQREFAVDEVDVAPEVGRLKATLAIKGLTTNFDNTRGVGKLFMAWIEQLRANNMISKPLPAFGWAKDESSQIIGFAVGGQCYMADGSTKVAFGPDAEIMTRYTPHGDAARWRNAVAAITGEPVLQVAVAASFGAPLMEFTGESGVAFSIWSSKSGTGKSSAFRLGASVWGNPRQNIFQLDDTDNVVARVMSETTTMPSYWDEIVLTDDRNDKLKNLIYKITQGRDKGRITSDIKVRHPGAWRTIMLVAANRSLKQFLTRDDDAADDPTAMRVLDLEHQRQSAQAAPGAALALAALDDHYGWAGVEYAQYLATHEAQLTASVAGAMQMIAGQIKASTSERFYVAGAAATLVGAAIAKKLGLVDFDLNTIADTLRKAITGSRLDVVAPQISIADIVNQFVHDLSTECVITKRFKPPGPLGDEKLEVKPFNPYHKRPYPAYQIAMREQILRIDREALIEWWGTRDPHYRRQAGIYTSRQLISLIKNEVAGVVAHAAIGAGTAFNAPKVYVIDISLVQSGLDHWLEVYTDDDKVVPLRAKPKLTARQPAPPPGAAP